MQKEDIEKERVCVSVREKNINSNSRLREQERVFRSNLNADLITRTNIIFITVYVHAGCDLRRLLIQCEQNVACFMVESFNVKLKWKNGEKHKPFCTFIIYAVLSIAVHHLVHDIQNDPVCSIQFVVGLFVCFS